MSKFHTGCQVVERTEETFVEHVSIGGERRRIEFTKPILWIQESEALIQFKHGGHVLKEGDTHNDFYGYLTSIEHQNPAGMAKAYSVTQDSSLEIVILAKVFKRPAIETTETIKNNASRFDPRYKCMYAYVPDGWRREAESEHTPDGKCYPMLGCVELGTGIIWTSKNTPEQNAALANEFKTKWAIKS